MQRQPEVLGSTVTALNSFCGQFGRYNNISVCKAARYRDMGGCQTKPANSTRNFLVARPTSVLRRPHSSLSSSSQHEITPSAASLVDDTVGALQSVDDTVAALQSDLSSGDIWSGVESDDDDSTGLAARRVLRPLVSVKKPPNVPIRRPSADIIWILNPKVATVPVAMSPITSAPRIRRSHAARYPDAICSSAGGLSSSTWQRDSCNACKA